MRTRLLMTASASAMAMLGLAATFLPQEILVYGGSEPTTLTVLLLQLTGAIYFGFAILNWMARGTLIGGIYGRPLTLGNFLHFTVGAIALLKQIPGLLSPVGIILTTLFTGFALWYGLVLFVHPGKVGQ